MVFRRCYLFICFLSVLFITLTTESQEAHTHGVATLTLALEGKTLDVQFESPAANIVGFEHQAASKKEKAIVAQAEIILNNPKRLFSFPGSNCESKNTVITVSGPIKEKHDKHKDHEEHNHSSSEHRENRENGHSELSAQYRFFCKDPKDLTLISLAFFREFQGIEKIDAMWVTKTSQGSTTLTATKPSISLR